MSENINYILEFVAKDSPDRIGLLGAQNQPCRPKRRFERGEVELGDMQQQAGGSKRSSLLLPVWRVLDSMQRAIINLRIYAAIIYVRRY